MNSNTPKKLADFVTLIRGITYKGELVGKPGPALLGLGSIQPGGGFRDVDFKTYGGDCPKKLMLAPGDLFASLKGATKDGKMIGSVARVPNFVPSGRLTQDTVKLEFIEQDNATQRYIYWLLRTPQYREYCAGRAMGSAVVALSREDFLSYPIPTLTHSRTKLVDLLEDIEERIRVLCDANITLERIAQALFKSWFVNFDPVCAKVEGLEPEGIDAATAGLFPGSFEESELGTVPKGWKLVPFGELLTFTIGGDWGDESPTEKNGTRVAIIRGTDIPDLQSGTANRVPVRYTSSKKLSTRKLQDGDIVLEVSGGSKDQPTGRSLYLSDTLLEQFDCPVEPASFCRLLRPVDHDTGILLTQHLTYIYSIGKTWEYQNQSTGIANFQTTHFLENELVAVPPAEVLTEFSSIVRPLIDRGHLSNIRELTQLRDTLLSRLISGQLRLPEMETSVENMLLERV